MYFYCVRNLYKVKKVPGQQVYILLTIGKNNIFIIKKI
jgi:hypothetical protein